MDNMHDDFWNDLLPELRDTLGLRPLSIDESIKAYNEASAVDFSEADIQRLIEQGKSDIPQEPGFGDAADHVDESTKAEFLQLNRDAGDADADVDDLVQRQRDEALNDEAEDDEDGDGDEPQSV